MNADSSTGIESFVERVSEATALKWRQSYRRRVNLDVEDISRRVVQLLATEYASGDWGSRSQDAIATKAGVANGKRVARCVGHLISVLHETDYILNGTVVMFYYEDNRLHPKKPASLNATSGTTF